MTKGSLTALCFVCAAAWFAFGGCATVGVREEREPAYHGKRTGPPAHAKAHGLRRKYAYSYYPDSSVYFDRDRKLYFYLQAGSWQVGTSLPSSIRIAGTPVSLSMDSDKPYVEFDTHKAKYPPGHKKKKIKGKGKGKKK